MIPLLTIEDLHVHFLTDRGDVQAVNGLNLHVERGETLGVVGESGSGKSVTSLAVMGLLPSPPAVIPNGRITFDGHDMLSLTTARMRQIRGNRIGMIFQDPMTSLNPFLRISRQLTEVLEHHRGISIRDALPKAIEMLERVGISDAARRIHSYPHEFSGGMRQRVMIAMSLLCEPELLIADEPTTALDVTVQAQILELLKDLQRDLGMAILLITHDLGVVAGTADRVLVMYGGKVMEQADTRTLFRNPRHPYTQGLMRSVPRLDQEETQHLHPIPGSPLLATEPYTGCPFAPRCDSVEARCAAETPPDRGQDGDTHVFCWLEGGK